MCAFIEHAHQLQTFTLLNCRLIEDLIIDLVNNQDVIDIAAGKLDDKFDNISY